MPRRIIVISGAGISVESGVRAFRTDSESGVAMWDEYSVDQVCNIQAFNLGFYGKTHDFYNKRRQELETVEPNLAHMRVAEWYQRYPGQVVNMTTNVDDLLERAGIPHKDVLHLHGYLPEVIVQQEEGGNKIIKDVGYSAIDPDNYHWAKPNVIFFGEYAPAYIEQNAIMSSLTTQDLVIVVGCSGVVIDFVDELVHWEKYGGYKTWVVNPKPNALEVKYADEGKITLWIAGAVETFGNPHFIRQVEKHLEG